MTPNRRKAGRAVADRIAELKTSVPEVAEEAQIDPTTIRRLIRGVAWPHEATRLRISRALGWPPGEIARIANAEDLDPDLRSTTTASLILELCKRYKPSH